MIAFIKLVRLPNLLIIAATQYLIRIFLDFSHYPKIEFPDLNFFFLSLSTVMIAAAGYIINDYFDIQTDMINKPQRVVVGHGVKRRVAMGAHIVINTIAILLGFYVFWQAGNLKLGFIHVLFAGLLWFYSTTYKRQFLIGNFIVAFMTAMVVLIVGIYEKTLIIYLVVGYAIFAFVISLLREIVKDMEDMEGDGKMNCRTIPLVLGIHQSKLIASSINLVLIGGICYFVYYLNLTNAYLHIVYISLLLLFPLFLVFWLLYRADNAKGYHRISTLIKLVMINGIAAMIFFYYL